MATSTCSMEREDSRAAVDDLPTDAFVDILLRVPQGNRWRLRLVCRRWRDVIRERILPSTTPAPVALAFVVNSSQQRHVWASAYVVDDLAEGRCRELWRSEVDPPVRRYSNPNSIWHSAAECVEGARPAMVGTRNGLLCLCDDAQPGGAITLVSPASRETVAVPPLPGSAQWLLTQIRGWHEAYSFAYDPVTERYRVVHVPCYLDRTGGFNVLQVFTLLGKGRKGKGSRWRDVAVPGGSCRVDAGLVSIGGATHWVTADTERVVSFDLERERVASTRMLPPLRGGGHRCRLAEVHGRLGVVSPGAGGGWAIPEKVEVWVLGRDRDRTQGGWSRRYNVQVVGVEQRLAWPHFAHGEHALTMDTKSCVFTHRTTRAEGARGRGEAWSVRVGDGGQMLSGIDGGGSIQGVFAYVNTQDPFSAYRSQAS